MKEYIQATESMCTCIYTCTPAPHFSSFQKMWVYNNWAQGQILAKVAHPPHPNFDCVLHALTGTSA